MKTASQRIEVHFKEAMNLAEQIRLMADEVKNIARQDIPAFGTITKRGWNSECADSLVKRELEIGSLLGKEGDELKKLAGEIEEQAREMYLAEAFNTTLAATRIY